MAEHSGEHTALDFDYVDDGIYVGTNYCCQTYFDEQLLRKGIGADVSLEGERIDAPFGVQSYLWLPVKDEQSPSPDQMELAVAHLEKLVAMGKKVYVHCKNGHGRAPTLVAAYLTRSHGLSADEAISLILAKRREAHLNEIQVAAVRAFVDGA